MTLKRTKLLKQPNRTDLRLYYILASRNQNNLEHMNNYHNYRNKLNKLINKIKRDYFRISFKA